MTPPPPSVAPPLSDTGPDAAAEALHARARQLLAEGRRPEALALLQRVAAALQERDAWPSLRQVLYEISQIHLQAGDITPALATAVARARLAARLDDAAARWRAVALVGLCHLLMGNHQEAARHLHAAGRGARAEGDTALEAMQCNNLVWLAGCDADSHLRAGHPTRALDVLLRAEPQVQRADELGFPAGSYDAMLWRANRSGWLRRTGRLDEAQQGYLRAYARAIGRDWVAVARHAALGLAQVAVQRGRLTGRDAPAPDWGGAGVDDPEPWLVRCVAVSDTPDALGFVNEALQLLAQRLRQAGRSQAAQRHLAHAARLLDAMHAERRALRDAVPASAFDVDRVVADGGELGRPLTAPATPETR